MLGGGVLAKNQEHYFAMLQLGLPTKIPGQVGTAPSGDHAVAAPSVPTAQ